MSGRLFGGVLLGCVLVLTIIGTSRLAPWRQSDPKGWRGADVETALASLGHAPGDAIHLERLTAYNGVVQQTDQDPKTASCGRNRPDGLALSRDLFFSADGSKHLCGTKVRVLIIDPDTNTVEQIQTRTIWDTMHARYTSAGDLFFRSEAAAQAWGIKKATIVLLEP